MRHADLVDLNADRVARLCLYRLAAGIWLLVEVKRMPIQAGLGAGFEAGHFYLCRDGNRADKRGVISVPAQGSPLG